MPQHQLSITKTEMCRNQDNRQTQQATSHAKPPCDKLSLDTSAQHLAFRCILHYMSSHFHLLLEPSSSPPIPTIIARLLKPAIHTSLHFLSAALQSRNLHLSQHRMSVLASRRRPPNTRMVRTLAHTWVSTICAVPHNLPSSPRIRHISRGESDIGTCTPQSPPPKRTLHFICVQAVLPGVARFV
jgi:hypothetical protein